jgi:hypothetical protein
VDIEVLRRFHANAQWDNWIKDLTTEQYQLIYEEPVYPRNIYLDHAPRESAKSYLVLTPGVFDRCSAGGQLLWSSVHLTIGW